MDLWLYTYGNGDFIYQILISVNFFMNHAQSFFQLAAMLSLAMFAAESTGVMPMRSGLNWTRFIKMYVVLAVFILTPYPGKVNVHDVITDEDRVVNMSNGQLPFGLIFPVATTSTIMYRLINLYQQNFEIDSNLSYTYSGMNFGANFIQSLDNADSYNDVFNRNFDQYMQNCGFPLMYKKGALSTLRSSNDIFATLADPQYTSAARFVKQVDFSDPTKTSVTSCSQAIADINKYYNDNKDNILQNNARMMGVSSTTGYDRFINSADATANSLMGISQGASQALKQAIGMNMIMTSLKNQAQLNGNGSLALAAYDAEQFQSYKYGGLLNGSASARSIPILVGTAFAMLFFLYPIMIFLAIMMGSYKGIGVFFQIVVAINLIPLIYEILNYMTTFYLQKKLGITIQGQGYNYDVSTSLYSFTDNMITAGNWLASSTPILAYAIVSGTPMALTSVFGHLNDPAKSAATKSGDGLAHGDMNMGNTTIDNHSFNNLSGNKLDDQVSMNSGVPIIKDTTSNGVRTNVGDNTFDVQYKDQLNTNVNLSNMAQHSLQNSLDSSKRESNNIGKQWQDQAQRLQNMSNDINSGQEWTKSLSNAEREAIHDAHNISSNLGFSFSGNGVSTSSSDSINKDLSKAKEIASRMSHSTNQHVSDAFSNSNSLINTSAHNVEQSVATSRALSDMQSNSSGVNSDFTTDWARDLRTHGIDPKSMTTEQQNASATEYANKYLHEKYGIKNNLLTPVTNVSNPTNGKAVNNHDIQTVDHQSQYTLANEQEKMQNKQNSSKSQIENQPAKVIKQQIDQVGQVPQDVAGTVMDAVTHPDRFFSDGSTKAKQTVDSNKPQIPD